jgi:Mg2+-importing ATPase
MAGLTQSQAEARLSEVGPNEPASAKGPSALRELFVLLVNPLAVILLIAAVISAFLGEHVGAAVIIAMVVLSVFVNFVQTYRSRRAVERLRERIATTATVLRDGQWREIPRREVVPGDRVRLAAGDLVPADARLLEARDLHVQEAALTGESLPAEREAGAEVFLGTSIVSGTATAEVLRTGASTTFGQIATRLAARAPETEFERGIRQFSLLIMRMIFFLVLFVLVVSLAWHRPAFESLLFAVALAVGLTPEFLPMITSVTLGAGAVRMARRKVIVKHLPAIQNLGSIDVLCSDKTGTLTAGAMVLERSVDTDGNPSDAPLRLAWLNSRFETGIKSPLDAAILARTPADVEGWAKRDEVPFDFERRCLSIVVERGQERLLITKGAPESVLARVALDDAARARSEQTCGELHARGLRVLAVASRPFEGTRCVAADEAELVLAGFIAFADPPLPDAADAISDLRRDGVAVKILTGDNELVARHVCGDVGLDVEAILLGSDIDRMSDPALAHAAERTTVFARVSPAQKTRILLALKHRRHVVGFLGDGINDAPSLHTADVGISVASAVDVARDAAEIILLERNLRVIHDGILEGRRAFGNVMKYLLMGTSSNFGNMFSMAGAALFLPFLPMLPTQILLNNFLYDLAQVTIPSDRVDEPWLRKPHAWDIRLIRNFMLFVGPVSSVYDFVTFFVLLKVFHAGERLFQTGWFVESLATQTLVLFIIRTMGSPLRSRPSAALAATTVAVVLIGGVLPFMPLASQLGFVPLPATYFAFLAVATATYLVLVEIVKRRLFG